MTRIATHRLTTSSDRLLTGLEVYRVGGAVRDARLGWPWHECDFVVVGATVEDMQSRGFRPVGRDFPVFLHPKTQEEYALARTERKSGHGYVGFSVHASPEVTLEEDLIRRDLTINAMAEPLDSQPGQGELVDPYGGLADLEARVLRHVSAAFSEDPLRVLRVARFLARYQGLGFTVADETRRLMVSMVESGEVSHLVAERVWKETEKALGEASPEAYFQLLDELGALAVLMPALARDAEMLRQALVKLDHLPRQLADEAEMVCWRMARLVEHLDRDEIEVLAQDLRLPSAVRDAAQQARLCRELREAAQRKGGVTATDLKAWLDGVDAWRRGERQQVLVALLAVDDTGLARLGNAVWKAATAVSPQSLVAQGLKGAEIGRALSEQREQAIDTALSEWHLMPEVHAPQCGCGHGH
ncbi:MULTISPECIES: polynucleotide adenylyltransferase [Cobetia]|uniref:Polynucleotide adenylyltransferase n=1 Tax=Cobetia crustatorum TaxID=553385 RepID=A0A558HH31_9GAMM|nr:MULTISPECIES: polynucleotide adenylyltransferase [Cobetia]TVU68442.1 polynucleotide adenylyltransferase [Cobetia crustatorum]